MFKFRMYVNSTFWVDPVLIVLRFLDGVFEKKRVVPFSTNSWIIGSVIIVIIWIIIFTFIFIKSIN